MNMGVSLPSPDRNEAAVMFEKSPYDVKTPWAPIMIHLAIDGQWLIREIVFSYRHHARGRHVRGPVIA